MVMSVEDRINQLSDVVFNAEQLYLSPHVQNLVRDACRREVDRLEAGGAIEAMPITSTAPTVEEANGMLL